MHVPSSLTAQPLRHRPSPQSHTPQVVAPALAVRLQLAEQELLAGACGPQWAACELLTFEAVHMLTACVDRALPALADASTLTSCTCILMSFRGNAVVFQLHAGMMRARAHISATGQACDKLCQGVETPSISRVGVPKVLNACLYLF
jgi:hypothetical protein